MELKELAGKLNVTEKVANGLIAKYGLDLGSITEQNIIELREEINSKALVTSGEGKATTKQKKVSHPVSTEIEFELENIKKIAQAGFDSNLGDIMGALFLKGAEIKTKKVIASGVSQIASKLHRLELNVDLDLNIWESIESTEIDFEYDPWS